MHPLKSLLFYLALPSAIAMPLASASPVSHILWIASISGPASILPAGADETTGWRSAEVTRTLAQGDQLAAPSGDSSHAVTMELRSDAGTFGLYPGSVVSLQRLDDQGMLLNIEQGEVEIKLVTLDPDRKIGLGTPNTGIEFLAAGRYHVVTDMEGNTRTIKTEAGNCLASLSSGQTFSVRGGQTASLNGTTYNVTGAPAAATSGRPVISSTYPIDYNYYPEGSSKPGQVTSQDTPQDASYAAPDPNNPLTMDPGEEQLAGAGDWRPLPNGELGWYPRVSPDWEPYTNGHWQFIDPWGWTWIDNARWGFATFHYGGWGRSNEGWYWVPGPPVYSPAQVAWVGDPGGLQVGWIPLGPGEVVGGPAFASSRLVNRDHLVVVSHETFVGAAPVNRNRVRVLRGTFDRASVQDHAMVNPERASILGPASMAVAHPPLAVLHRSFVSRVTAAPEPLSVDRRLQLHQTGAFGRPINRDLLQDRSRIQPNYHFVGNAGGTVSPSYRPNPQPVQRPPYGGTGAPAHYGQSIPVQPQQRVAGPGGNVRQSPPVRPSPPPARTQATHPATKNK